MVLFLKIVSMMLEFAEEQSGKAFVQFIPIGPDFEGPCLFHMALKSTTIWMVGNESMSILKGFGVEKLFKFIPYRP